MRAFIGFVLGTVFGVSLAIGVLFGSGHLNMNTKEVSYVMTTTQFDGFSFR